MMARGLDHIVHAVRDLDAAADLYRRLGFTVGARNRHPWGTHNHIVQLPGFFIELLTMAEPEKLGSDGFSVLFGSFNRRFLERQEGLSMLILESADAEGDAQAFREAAIAASDAMRFEREGRRPDGSPVKVAFSLGFARDAGAPDIGFAVCQQHYPENFWNPAFQSHPNSATGIASAIIVAENPTDHHIFLSAFAGERELQSTSSGLRIATGARRHSGDGPFRLWQLFWRAAPRHRHWRASRGHAFRQRRHGGHDCELGARQSRLLVAAGPHHRRTGWRNGRRNRL